MIALKGEKLIWRGLREGDFCQNTIVLVVKVGKKRHQTTLDITATVFKINKYKKKNPTRSLVSGIGLRSRRRQLSWPWVAKTESRPYWRLIVSIDPAQELIGYYSLKFTLINPFRSIRRLSSGEDSSIIDSLIASAEASSLPPETSPGSAARCERAGLREGRYRVKSLFINTISAGCL